MAWRTSWNLFKEPFQNSKIVNSDALCQTKYTNVINARGSNLLAFTACPERLIEPTNTTGQPQFITINDKRSIDWISKHVVSRLSFCSVLC